MRLFTTVLAAQSVGCAHAAAPASFGRGADWAVDVLVAEGDRTIEARYDLVVERVGRDRWSFATARTSGQWTGPDGASSFDSAAPSPADPWPLTLQHVVSSVPAEVQVAEGRPAALADLEGWRRAALDAVYASAVPAAGLDAGRALVDPEGLLSDLARTFPGRPEGPGPWVRREPIGGVPAVRTESCTAVRDGWRCEGTAEAEPGSNGVLFEVACATDIDIDRRGVVSVTSRYSGTLVTLSPSGSGVIDRPIAGIRSARRVPQ